MMIQSGKHTARNTAGIAIGATRGVLVSFAGQLDSGELLTGTPTITAEVIRGRGEVADLTVANIGRNTTAEDVNGETVAIDEGVVASITCDAGAILNTMYLLTVTCGTDGDQTLVGYCRLEVSV